MTQGRESFRVRGSQKREKLSESKFSKTVIVVNWLFLRKRGPVQSIESLKQEVGELVFDK